MNESSKCAVACNFCRAKKIRCSSEQPCTNCLDHNVTCVFQPPPVRARNKIRETNKTLRERISRLEGMLSNVGHRDDAAATSPCSPLPRQLPLPTSTDQPTELSPGMSQPPESALPVPPPVQEASSLSGSQMAGFAALSTMSPTGVKESSFTQARPVPLLPPTPDPSQTASVGSPSLDSLEYHGPSSYLAICSKPASKWLSEKTGTAASTSGLGELSLSVAQRMKLDRSLRPIREPEPDLQTAWSYVQAYFNHRLECIFGLINRTKFEARLLATFDGSQTDDFAWYALRNTVYAGGCKVMMTQDPAPDAFLGAQAQSWAYFENALSAHTDLVYVRSDLMAIQALMAMAFYSEGFGNPALEYMLISNAIRLAQSKGLHRQPPQSWTISQDEVLERNWLFWVIYAYDKHVAFRSGRPSAINDDEISCEIPTEAADGSGMSVEFVTQVVEHSRIASDISREVTSFKASCQPPEVIVAKMQQQESRLRAWFQNLPPAFQYVPMGTTQSSSEGLHRYHIVFLQYCYHGSLIAIHSAFTYPWNPAGRLGPAERLVFQDQIALSTKMVVQSSRQIILATRWFDPQGSCPTWLVFFYPLLGLINIFISVLRAPLDNTTATNLALTEVAAGHFGYLEYLSNNQMTFPYVGEIGRLARAVVKSARDRQSNVSTRHTSPPPTDEHQAGPCADPTAQYLTGGMNSPFPLDLGSMMETDFGLENWPTFVPSLSAVSSMVMKGFPQDMDMFPG
ncbi:fungal-specific transcription factor domain-containing protein [Aspergillus oleicola]